MYISTYKNISSNNLELQNLITNSFDQIQTIENIKNSLKRSTEEFEAKQLLKKPNLLASVDISNVTSNDLSSTEQIKNSSSNISEVSEIIEKKLNPFIPKNLPFKMINFTKS